MKSKHAIAYTTVTYMNDSLFIHAIIKQTNDLR